MIIQRHVNLREHSRVLAQTDGRTEIHMARNRHEQKKSLEEAVLRMVVLNNQKKI